MMYSRDELIEEVKSLAAELDRTPTVQELMEQSSISRHQYRREFGSWNSAVEAAGLEPNPGGRKRRSPAHLWAVDRERYTAGSSAGAFRATELTYRINGRPITLSFPLHVKGANVERITGGVFMVNSRGDEDWLLHFEAETTDEEELEWWVPLTRVAEKLESGELEVKNAEIHG